MRISDWSSDVCSSYLRRSRGHLPDIFSDQFHRHIGLGHPIADAIKYFSDLSYRAMRLRSERLHLIGNHGEAPAGLPGPSCLNSGVQRQEIGLCRELRDLEPDSADVIGLLAHCIKATLPRIAYRPDRP